MKYYWFYKLPQLYIISNLDIYFSKRVNSIKFLLLLDQNVASKKHSLIVG